jgi:hypothetical protein
MYQIDYIAIDYWRRHLISCSLEERWTSHIFGSLVSNATYWQNEPDCPFERMYNENFFLDIRQITKLIKYAKRLKILLKRCMMLGLMKQMAHKLNKKILMMWEELSWAKPWWPCQFVTSSQKSEDDSVKVIPSSSIIIFIFKLVQLRVRV